jgi:hypothetical protein
MKRFAHKGKQWKPAAINVLREAETEVRNGIEIEPFRRLQSVGKHKTRGGVRAGG